MDESPNLFHALLGLKQAPKTVEIQSLLEMLPHAVMLVDSQNLCILFANSRLSEVTGYALSELIGTQVANLFTDWDDKILGDLSPIPSLREERKLKVQSVTRNLIQHDQVSMDVDLIYSAIHPREKTLLIALEPHDVVEHTREGSWPFSQRSLLQQRSSKFWEALISLLSAAQERDCQTALKLILDAGSTLTGARVLAIYQVQDRFPQLALQVGVGEVHLLPQELSLQELIYLNKPGQWEAGNRPSCTLHRMARAAQLSFVASAPIGQPNAIVGLVVVADDQGVAHSLVPPVAELVAAAVASIFQQQAWMANAQFELQMQASQLRVKATLEEQMHEGIVLLDPTLRIMRMNLAAEMVLGYASREVTGQAVEKLLIGPETLLPALTAAQQGSPTYNLGTVRLYRRNGDAFLAGVRVFPVKKDDLVEEIIVLIEDLSEQEQIRLHAEHLEQRALLGEITAIFAHEVGNPLNSISTGLQLMAMNLPEEDPNRENIMGMMQDCDRLADLKKSVLAFSRPIDYEMEPLDVPLLLKRLLDRLRPRMAKLNVQYDLRAEPDCPPILGNLRALEQVFTNLITNALQAMSENGGSLMIKVQPTTTPEGRTYLEVSVADTGPGIPKELQDRIFQPFFTTERNGTGLGLAIAKRVVTAHKGNISLVSVPGGCVFQVQIPATMSE